MREEPRNFSVMAVGYRILEPNSYGMKSVA